MTTSRLETALRPATIARNYAEALFELGEKSGQTELYAELLDAVAGAIETRPGAGGADVAPGDQGGQGADPGGALPVRRGSSCFFFRRW